MATATLPRPTAPRILRPTTPARTAAASPRPQAQPQPCEPTVAASPARLRPRVSGRANAAAAVGSILGCVVAIGIAAVGLLTVPVAGLLVFGPALLELL